MGGFSLVFVGGEVCEKRCHTDNGTTVP